MSTPADAEPPFALDGTVGVDKLRELLAVQAESAWLDYKLECDLTGAAGVVALAEDIGAMGIRGGYLVIGADGVGHTGRHHRRPGRAARRGNAAGEAAALRRSQRQRAAQRRARPR